MYDLVIFTNLRLIMAQNTLFNFIELYLAKPDINLPNCRLLQRDTTEEGKEYYRFELEENHPVQFTDDQHTYTLYSHHVSVYKTESQSNPFLSQYHYTAYFEDEQGTRYRLHVYFNDKNEMTTQPVLSIQQQDGNYTPVASEQLNAAFIHLASANAKPLIKHVRKQLMEIIKDLELSYKDLEEEASQLSVSLARNYENYIAKLTEISATIEHLIPLVNHKHYQGTQKLMARMRIAVVERYGQKQDEQREPQTSPQTESQPKPSNKGKQPGNKVSPAKKSTHQPTYRPSQFDKEVQAIASQFAKLGRENDEIRTTKLAELLAKTYELSLLLEDKKTVASLPSLVKLDALHKKLYEAGEKLFPRLLINGQFKLAERLSAFHYLLDNYLDSALQNRNHQLLDFILKYGDVNINNQEVTVKGMTYPSAIHCCLDCDSPKTPMVDCLSVLIGHGASTLPIAHTVLSTLHHPLKKAFSAHRDKTIESIPFYKQLISLLKLHLEQAPSALMDEVTRRKFEEAITSYQVCIKDLAMGPLPDNASAKKLVEQTATFREKHGETEAVERVRNDPEIIAAKQLLQLRTKIFLQKLKPEQRREYNRLCAKNLGNIDKAMDHFGIKLDDYEVLKQHALRFYKNATALIDKQIELLNVQKQILRYQTITKPSKRYKKLLVQQNELLVEIQALDAQCSVKDLTEIQQLEEGESHAMDALPQLFGSLLNIANLPSKWADLRKVLEKAQEEPLEKEKTDGNDNNLANRFTMFSLALQVQKVSKQETTTTQTDENGNNLPNRSTMLSLAPEVQKESEQGPIVTPTEDSSSSLNHTFTLFSSFPQKPGRSGASLNITSGQSMG